MNRFRLSPSTAPGFARRFLPVWALGLVGVAALLLQPLPPALLASAPALRELPPVLVRLLVLLNPLLLLTAMAAIGAACAPRVGLRSALAGDARARLDARAALAVGTTLAVVIAVVDAALAPWLGAAWQQVVAQANAAQWLPALLLGVLYGGITEEVVMRWGLMGLVAWGTMAVRRRARGSSSGQPSALVAWLAIATAAAVFAAGHLPALAHSVELSGPVVARTLGLNLLAGIAYGWLFWRRSLETAMLAHATTHVGFALARWVG
jgi:membrane protease YdiL (CAAX protease family)